MSQLACTLALLAAVASSAAAQRVQLELRPRAGDTLRLRLDQVSEMSGSRKGARTKPVVTTLSMFSRAIVESSEPQAAIILAVTDSVDISTDHPHAQPLSAETQRQLEGRQMRLRVATDGSVAVADAAGSVPREVSDLVAVMPASFPRGTVAVGDVWLREMPIPPAASIGVPLSGVVKASFRLDSVSSDGGHAYVSMRGTLRQGPEPATSTDATLSGTVTGHMVVDRRRGWLSESRFLVQMRATVVPAGTTAATPMQFRMKITQHMRVVDKR